MCVIQDTIVKPMRSPMDNWKSLKSRLVMIWNHSFHRVQTDTTILTSDRFRGQYTY